VESHPYINRSHFTSDLNTRYLLSLKSAENAADDDAAEGNTSHARGYARDARDGDNGDSRSRGAGRGRMSKEQKKAQRGANKGRKFGKVRDELDLCWRVANGATCEFGDE
jgi:tRNA-dihydrouridine synthase 3